MEAPGHCDPQVQAGVVFPTGVMHERSAIESEGGNPVAETLDGTGGRGANGLAQLPGGPAGIGRQRCKVSSHLQARLPDIISR